MKHTALIIILILAAALAGAADISLIEIQVSTTITGAIIATWNNGLVIPGFNDLDLELWLLIPPSCQSGGICHKGGRVRWQGVPAGRGLMVLELVGMPEECTWTFNARNLYTGELIPLPVVWLD